MKELLFKMRRFFLIVSILAFLMLVFLASSIILGRWVCKSKPPNFLGNHKKNIMMVNDDEKIMEPFTFLVVGDIGLKRHFVHFIENIEFHETPDFGFFLGDFVKNPEKENHCFFNYRYSKIELMFPVFLLAGNHDIALGKYKSKPNAFFLEDFEETYGPANFFFKHHGCLFVAANDCYNDNYVDYLREVLARESRDAVLTFVLMHIPPTSIIPAKKFRPLEREEEFLSLMKEFDVDYFFSGDFHSYYRLNKDGVDYIITGGGGSKLCYDENKCSFHHVIVISVNPKTGKITERVYPIREVFDIVFDYEKLVITKVYPVLKRSPLLSWISILAILLVFMASTIVYIRIARRKREF
ncbi:MAG: metallophosphoesterase [Deltaproteobacteria bacterium]|uniref:Metallophosphoesterase n=1 Tax=Candidatus Zymogenus saltonus TaxID=2844893 RepID=A0A9D8KG98_9DELT|nr:metallophosphoesterase [Candidatus Zymogenus saltonus]